ncbi:hypothetical protein [Miltoncostaea oceani]|uniref:hypothetical protein n=1 Tax=Miltoncostaea oceani TaxID=2843216 RepID=UPI001C3D712D|nr:hypothetical protein [Miltoncostaea oceani]
MVLAAVLAIGFATAPAVAQDDLDPVARCVRDNLIRYAPPDRAVVDQYLSLESACRERIESQGGAEVEVTPGGAGGGGGDSSGGDGGGAAGTPSVGGADGVPVPDRGEAGAGGTTPADPAVPTGTPSARPAVLAALGDADTATPANPTALVDGPPWLLALIGGAIVSVAGAAWLGVRSRPR